MKCGGEQIYIKDRGLPYAGTGVCDREALDEVAKAAADAVCRMEEPPIFDEAAANPVCAPKERPSSSLMEVCIRDVPGERPEIILARPGHMISEARPPTEAEVLLMKQEGVLEMTEFERICVSEDRKTVYFFRNVDSE